MSLHFDRAQIPDKAWYYSVLAGDRARSKYANVEAATFLRRALDAVGQVDRVPDAAVAEVSESLGDVLERAARFAEAGSAYRRARRLAAADAATVARLHHKEGVLREREGKYGPALRWYTRGLHVIEETAKPDLLATRAQLELDYAGVRYRQGRFNDCLEWCDRAGNDARAAEDEAVLAHVWYLNGIAQMGLGSREGRSSLEAALRVYQRIGDPAGESNVRNNIGVDAYYDGNWREAVEEYTLSRAARERVGDVVGAATTANNIAEILSDQGHFQPAEELFREALDVFGASGYAMGEALVESNLGRLATRQGRAQETVPLLQRALERFQGIQAGAFVQETRVRLAEALLAAGEQEKARRELEELDGLPRADRLPAAEPGLERVRGRLLAACGELDAGRLALLASLEAADGLGADYERFLTLEALADCLPERLSDAKQDEMRRIAQQLDLRGLASGP